MSLQILCQKLDKLNEKEKRVRMTYDVRGTNKYQHRFIKDLKEDFKDDLILRYGNKPYGVGWNQENEEEEEIVTDPSNQEPNEVPSKDQVVEEDEGIEEEYEYENTINSNVGHTNFRPGSGKFSLISPQNRPVSASTVIRPMTASSKIGDTTGASKFMFGARPISAIPKNMKAVNSGIHDTSEFTILSNKSPLGMYPQLYQEQQQQTMDAQSKTIDPNQTAKARANESMFWKNTKKYDVSHSTKQFDTKKLLFEVQHANPNLIATSDLSFLKNERVHSTLQNSKLVAPKDYDFHDIARSKNLNRTDRELNANYTEFEERSNDMIDLDSNSDLKNIFNQSLSYIQLLRVASPSDIRPESAFWTSHDQIKKNKKSQRPVTAHPLLSTASASSATRKAPLEVVHEQGQGSQRSYFSSLSDVRKRLFFSRLNSLEIGQRDHPNLNKELKSVEWEAFNDIFTREDVQSVNLIVVDLNSFDHVRHELEVSKNGTVKAKDKEDYKEISQVYKDFLQITKTNLASIIVYVELPEDRVIEVFSRVLVYEKDENEYDLLVWRNIYRYLLHRMVVGNANLYSGQKTYNDLSRIVKDIIEDQKDMVSPIFNPIQRSRDCPIIVERNGNVYNFDFHSYITECSAHYASILSAAQQSLQESNPNKRAKLRGKTPVGKSPVRPHSALDPKNKLFSSTVLHSGMSGVLSPVLSSTMPRPNTALFMSPASQIRPTSSHGLENLPPQSPPFVRNVETYSGDKINRLTRAEAEKKNISFQDKEKLDMTLNGDRMEIYQPTKVSANTLKSDTWGQYNNFFPAARGYNTEYPMYNNSRDGFRGIEDMYRHDPNGITLKYKSPVMKKRPNTAIKRPHSAHKSDLKGINADGSIATKRDFTSPKTVVSNGSNARFKF